jgi:hypothetical protein
MKYLTPIKIIFSSVFFFTSLVISAHYAPSNEVLLVVPGEVPNAPTANINTNTYYIDKDVLQPEVLSKAINNQNEEIFHLFTHGKPGQLRINGKWLEKEAIASFLIEQFSLPLGEMSEGQSGINFYDPNFAQGDLGLEAITHLEKDLGILWTNKYAIEILIIKYLHNEKH